MNLADFREWCIQRHDVECNQKYDTWLLYSMHLRYVVANFHRFKHLLPKKWQDYIINVLEAVEMGCWGHDLIEDARITYNDIKDRVGKAVADIIYCCTEEKGKDRDERHPEKYYKELSQNDLAVFVKLCDIMGNVQYSILTNSSMYKKHKKEHQKTIQYLYTDRYKEMFDYLDKLFALW